mmetsp:Transcript_80293/g.227393  ORF Transcript_80293/g.227393 Transcript_80293/m.227393 type:complete len:318 (-) Transcript_80293:88-1041(-)
MMNSFEAQQNAMMQQQMMMMRQCAMMQQAAMGKCADAPGNMGAASDAAGSASSASKLRQAPQAKKKPRQEKDDKITTIFVGGLRKSTTEDKVTAHFGKFGQVDNVDIKRLPDGTSRGFAFVKFVEKEPVDKVMEASSSHMIDNKWVAVRPHGGTDFSKNEKAEKERDSVAATARVEERPGKSAEASETNEEEWSERYLAMSAQVGAMQQKEAPADAAAPAPQAVDPFGGGAAAPSMPACNMMGNMMGNMGMMAMMNPMMMSMMGAMNPCMMGMMGGMRPMGMMGGCMPGGAAMPARGVSAGDGGDAPRPASDRYSPY